MDILHPFEIGIVVVIRCSNCSGSTLWGLLNLFAFKENLESFQRTCNIELIHNITISSLIEPLNSFCGPNFSVNVPKEKVE